MERHSHSALRIAQWLEGRPQVENVYYPGLTSHPQHALAARQMQQFGGMISLRLKGDDAYARRVIGRLSLFTLAESLGGVESLIEHPAIMTHATIPEQTRAQLGIGDALVRLSVGVEDVEEILAINLRGVIPESQAVLKASNQGVPVILDDQSDAGQAYSDTVDRLLGKEKEHRFLNVEKKGFFERLFGGR